MSASLLSTSLFSATLDMRHEYRSDSEQHATRIKVNERIGNIYFSSEVKFKGSDGKFLSNLQSNGWEFEPGYIHQFNDKVTVIPGMPIESNSQGMSYKPQVRVNYVPETMDALTLSGRYRLFLIQNNLSDNQRLHHLTANVFYNVEDWVFGLEGNYYKADSYNIFDDKETDYELNSSVSKSIGAWAPYAELGYLGYKKDGGNTIYGTNNDHELRTRVGVIYNF